MTQPFHNNPSIYFWLGLKITDTDTPPNLASATSTFLQLHTQNRTLSRTQKTNIVNTSKPLDGPPRVGYITATYLCYDTRNSEQPTRVSCADCWICSFGTLQPDGRPPTRCWRPSSCTIQVASTTSPPKQTWGIRYLCGECAENEIFGANHFRNELGTFEKNREAKGKCGFMAGTLLASLAGASDQKQSVSYDRNKLR